MPVTPDDLRWLTECVDLAEVALIGGHDPFGSILVAADGIELLREHNRVGGGDQTRHPELAIAQWSAQHLTPAARAAATVYTSGEHCPMCAAAHAWVGLGRIVYAASSDQLTEWLTELGRSAAPVRCLPIASIAPGVRVDGPEPRLTERIRGLHARRHTDAG